MSSPFRRNDEDEEDFVRTPTKRKNPSASSSSWKQTPRKVQLWIKHHYHHSSSSSFSSRLDAPPVPQSQQDPTTTNTTTTTNWNIDTCLAAFSSHRDEFPMTTTSMQETEDYDNDTTTEDDNDLIVVPPDPTQVAYTQSLLQQLNWEGKYYPPPPLSDDDENHKKEEQRTTTSNLCEEDYHPQESSSSAAAAVLITKNTPNEDEDEENDGFGDFQEATTTMIPPPLEIISTTSPPLMSTTAAGVGYVNSEPPPWSRKKEHDKESATHTPTVAGTLLSLPKDDIVIPTGEGMDRTPLVTMMKVETTANTTAVKANLQMDRTPLYHDDKDDDDDDDDTEEEATDIVNDDDKSTTEQQHDDTSSEQDHHGDHTHDDDDDDEDNNLTANDDDEDDNPVMTSQKNRSFVPDCSTSVSQLYDVTVSPSLLHHHKPEPNTPIANNYSHSKGLPSSNQSPPLSSRRRHRRGRRLFLDTDTTATSHNNSGDSNSGNSSSEEEASPSPARRGIHRPFQSSFDRSATQSPGTPEEEKMDTPVASSTTQSVPSVVRLVTTTQPNVMTTATTPPNHHQDRNMMSPLPMSTPRHVVHSTTPRNLTKPLRLSLQLLDRQSSIAASAAERQQSLTGNSFISTPEGRFFRRSSQIKQWLLEDDDDNDNDDNKDDNDDWSLGAASLGSLRSLLPDGFRTTPLVPSEATLDQILYDTLNELEWDWIPYWKMESLLQKDDCDESYVPLWLDQITEQLSELDVTHLRLAQKLHKCIQPRKEELEEANQCTLALSKSLQLCEMYIQRSKDSIQWAKYGQKHSNGLEQDHDDVEAVPGGVMGANRLLQLWDTQDAYSDLDKLLARVGQLFDRERILVDQIEGFDVREAVSLEQCQALLGEISEFEQVLSTPEMLALACLEDLRERVAQLRGKSLVGRLHTWLETITVRCCHASIMDGTGFDGVEYQRLMDTILLAELGGQDDTSSATHQVAASISTSIHTALLLETQKSFGMALLCPTDSENEESEYDQELLALSTNAYLDPSRMAIWAHNLVTIRFDFELQKNHLPAVTHKLCWQLTNILHSHHVLLSWHEQHASSGDGIMAMSKPDARSKAAVMQTVFDELSARRSSIWNTCVKVLEECVEEYLKFASKKKLFEWGLDGTCDDSSWYSDLLALEDVVSLIQQFLSLAGEFLEGVSEQSVNDGSILYEKMEEILRKHVCSLEIEAMNHSGMTLYKDTWECQSLNVASGQPSKPMTLECIREEITSSLHRDGIKLRSKQNRFGALDKTDSSLLGDGNPFDQVDTPSPERSSASEGKTNVCSVELQTLIRSYLASCLQSAPMLPGCFAKAILPWMGRILTTVVSLPRVTAETLDVMTSVSTLYLTTAFRITTGSAGHERILLGIDQPTPSVKLEELSARRSSETNGGSGSSAVFGFGFRQGAQTLSGVTSHSSPFVSSPFADAEICSPLPCEMGSARAVRDFIVDAQEKLKGVAKLNLVDKWVCDPNPSASQNLADLACQSARVLEKRLAALWGCAFLAVALDIISEIVSSEKNGAESAALQSYVRTLSEVTTQIIEMGSRLACIRAIRGRIIVRQIMLVGSGWEESKLHEEPNQYIDSVCDFVAMLWCSLVNARNVPRGAIDSAWRFIVEGGFASLLDGFSRVTFCSTEGRALMSMDVACFANELRGRGIQERLQGHASSPPPPLVSSERGMSYVDTYIKIFYFPPMDALAWIKENYSRYQRNHMVALIVGSAASSSENRIDSVSKLVRTVRGLYADPATQKAKISSV